MSERMVDDRDVYLQARSVVRGESQIDPIFDEFVGAFTASFGSTPLTVLGDQVGRGERGRAVPRLRVVVEKAEDAQCFNSGARIELIRASRREVERIFRDTVPTGAVWSGRAKALVMDVQAFETLAIKAVHQQVSEAQIADFGAGLGLGEQYLCARHWAPWPPVIFVHTDAQAEALRASGEPERWSEIYYGLLREFDEFDLITRGDIQIKVDSEETFQRDYRGSSYYYF